VRKQKIYQILKNIERIRILDKWTFLDKGMSNDKLSWIDQYANQHKINENMPVSLTSNLSNDVSLLPLSKRIFAQTLGLDLVAVQPMASPTGLNENERKRLDILKKRQERLKKLRRVLYESETPEEKKKHMN